MIFDYCHKKCDIGKKASENFLMNCESAIDAAIDFRDFVNECLKNCPHKKNDSKKVIKEENN